jgi:hypothetical protein
MLFLAVTACWVFGLAAAEQDWIGYHDLVLPIAAALSALSVVVTGYLGRVWDALWLGWIPGAAMLTVGFAMTPDIGGDETGATMAFVGGLLLAIGWPAYFFPLIVLGAELRGRRDRRRARSDEFARPVRS